MLTMEKNTIRQVMHRVNKMNHDPIALGELFRTDFIKTYGYEAYIVALKRLYKGEKW